MSQIKFKICPTCGEHNPPARLECQKCEADLTGVKIVDENSLNKDKSVSVNKETHLFSNLVKKCDCGAVNPSQARKCTVCGEDISDISPVQNQSSANQFILRAIDDEYSFTLDKTITIVGREAEMKDYLCTKSYVSRNHSKFTIIDTNVYIVNMSATNSTFVNNKPISCETSTLLKNGDEIGFGGKLINGNRQIEAAYFIFEATT
jgi:ribosomal protein L40E